MDRKSYHQHFFCKCIQGFEKKDPMIVIPYIAGMSEDIRRVCRKFSIREVQDSEGIT